MAKTLRDQLRDRGLVTPFAAKTADDLAEARVRRECFDNALRASRLIEVNGRQVRVEHRRIRAAGGRLR